MAPSPGYTVEIAGGLRPKATYYRKGEALFQEVYERVGKSWPLAHKELMKVLSSGKQATVKRWICITRDWDKEVAQHCSKWKWLVQSYVIGNDFLVGAGLMAKFKLKPDWAIAAFELLKDKHYDGHVPSSDFVQNFCGPMKKAEGWVNKRVERYGADLTTKSPPFRRLVAFLKTEQGRQAINACSTQKIKLSGNENGQGVKQCIALLVWSI